MLLHLVLGFFLRTTVLKYLEIFRGCIIKNYSPLASHHWHILALLLLHVSADRTWDLLADRVGHLNIKSENQALLSGWFLLLVYPKNDPRPFLEFTCNLTLPSFEGGQVKN